MELQWDGVERRDIVARRRHRVRRFLDRRGGFDRRHPDPVFGPVVERPALLIAALIVLNTLSLIDGFYTAVEVGAGVAREANPVLAAAGGQNPFLALAVKVGAMAFVTALIWLNRRRRPILVTGLAGLVAYAGLVVYHRYALSALGLL